MTPEQIIRDIYDVLKGRLPASLISKLTFKEPDYLDKLGTKIYRGRILPQRTKSIFDASWCFYQVGVARHAVGGAGSIGFVCYPENKKCGKGIHARIVSDLITRYVAAHPTFVASQRGERAQCIFSNYPAMQPIDKPADDLAALITATFPQLELLSVSK